jgi:hypothetical protein
MPFLACFRVAKTHILGFSWSLLFTLCTIWSIATWGVADIHRKFLSHEGKFEQIAIVYIIIFCYHDEMLCDNCMLYSLLYRCMSFSLLLAWKLKWSPLYWRRKKYVTYWCLGSSMKLYKHLYELILLVEPKWSSMLFSAYLLDTKKYERSRVIDSRWWFIFEAFIYQVLSVL